MANNEKFVANVIYSLYDFIGLPSAFDDCLINSLLPANASKNHNLHSISLESTFNKSMMLILEQQQMMEEHIRAIVSSLKYIDNYVVLMVKNKEYQQRKCKFCFYCRKANHFKRNCRFLKRDNRLKIKSSQVSFEGSTDENVFNEEKKVVSRRKAKFCTYCKKENHLKRNCWKMRPSSQVNETHSEIQKFCTTYCKKENNLKRNCWKMRRKKRLNHKSSQDNQDTIDNHNMACKPNENSLQPKKLRKPGVTILKEILKTIKLDENLIRENNEILQDFLSSFIIEMKKDELFNLLFQRFHFTGSYYSDLRISQPDEFDINVVLKLPFKSNEIEVNYHPQVPSYALYRVKNPESIATIHPKLPKLFQNGYIMQENMRQWIQSVVDKALQTYKTPRGKIIRIRPSAAGPARTIQLQKRKGIIDIDLVPVISHILETNQPGMDGRVCAKLGSTLQTFLVPKPYAPVGQAPVNSADRSRLWRTHFPDAEQGIIHNIGCVKPVIKLLKLLRDKEDWKILASYYLKTVVMWMLLQNNDLQYWNENKIDERFIEALEKLAGFVENKNIPYYFSKKNNLISKIHSDQAVNINKRLCALIKEVKTDPTKFWKVFNVTPTF